MALYEEWAHFLKNPMHFSTNPIQETTARMNKYINLKNNMQIWMIEQFNWQTQISRYEEVAPLLETIKAWDNERIFYGKNEQINTIRAIMYSWDQWLSIQHGSIDTMRYRAVIAFVENINKNGIIDKEGLDIVLKVLDFWNIVIQNSPRVKFDCIMFCKCTREQKIETDYVPINGTYVSPRILVVKMNIYETLALLEKYNQNTQYIFIRVNNLSKLMYISALIVSQYTHSDVYECIFSIGSRFKKVSHHYYEYVDDEQNYVNQINTKEKVRALGFGMTSPFILQNALHKTKKWVKNIHTKI